MNSNKLINSPTVTLAKGLGIFEFIALHGEQRGVTLQEISSAMQIPRSNVYRYLTTFCENCWLEKDDDSSRYFIGSKVLQFAGAFLQKIDLRNIARPLLEELAFETKLTVHLAILDGSSILYIDKVESNSPIQMRSRLGMMAPCYCTAVGKAMLACLKTERALEILPDPLIPRTNHTIIEKNRLIQHLAVVKELGFALDNEENEEGIGCIGAAIRNFDKEMIAGISVSTLVQNLDAESISHLGNQVRKVANMISEKMGYRETFSEYVIQKT